jgi:hypothetical protein
MKIEIDGNNIRFYGNNGVDLIVYAHSEGLLDRFSLSLCYDGFQHGCLPMVEVPNKETIVVFNTLEKGKQLLR